MPNRPLLAVDTNVLIDLAAKSDTILDCYSTIRRKLPLAPVIILPTVIQETAAIAHLGDSLRAKKLALKALQSIRSPWEFQPMNYVPVGHGIMEETARKIRRAGLIPDDEINDSLIIAEAALAKVTILISSDSHVRDIDQVALNRILDECDVGSIVIA